ncbi:hypothetical protein [Spirosoma aerophilum]
MKNLKLSITVFVFSFILMTGCEKDTLTDSRLTQPPSTSRSARLSAGLKEKLVKLRSSLPAGYEKRLQRNTPLLSKIDPQYREMVSRAITPTPCNDNTPLNQWLGQQLADWDDEVFFFAAITGMLDFPTYDALLFENSSANQYFGVSSEYSQRTTTGFKDLRRFWNIQSDNMVLAAMHGSMLLDREKVIRIDKIIYGDSQPVAEFYADLIITLLDEVPQYRRGNHPIFTFNAFAQPSFNFPPVGVIPPKIIMGDGIVDAYYAIGYGDVASQAILAHEYGHQIQFQLNLFEAVDSPEATRRTELMADAYSAYYLSHSRGASMQWKRVKQFLQVFFNIGDCGFTSNGHHGTPTQRMAAAEWGYSVADAAQKQGHILTSQNFTALFEAQLPTLVTY